MIQLMILPLVAAILILLIHAYLGIHIIARGVIFVDLALAQVAAMGYTIATLIGFAPGSIPAYMMGVGATLIGALLLSFSRLDHERVPQEALIGVVYVAASAATILLAAQSPSGSEHVEELLTGTLLWVTWPEIWRMALIYGGVGMVHWFLRKRFFTISLDPEKAAREGWPLRWWDFVFYGLFGIIVTSAVGVAGVLVVFSFLVIPAVIAFMFASKPRRLLAVAWGVGIVATVVGLALSFQFDLPTGPLIVCVFALTLWVALVISGLRGRGRSAALLATLVGYAALPADAADAQQGPTGTLIVANMSDHTATLIDLDRGAVVATLPTGVAPHEIAVTADGRTAVITNYGDRSGPGRTLTVIDVPSASVRETIDLSVYERPHGVAILAGDTLVAVTAERQGVVVIVDLRTGEVVGDIPTNGQASHMLTMDASGRRIFTTNIVDGTLSEIDPGGSRFVRTIEVAPMIEGLTITPDGSQVWVGSNEARTVSVVDAVSGEILETFVGFGFPYRMGVTPDNRLAVLVDPAKSEIRVVDVASREEIGRIAVPSDGVVGGAEFPGSASPEGIAMGRGSRYAYVSLQGRNEAAAIDLTTLEIVATYPTGTWPDGIGYSPHRR